MSDSAAIVTLKPCKKCGLEKAFCEFTKNKPSRDGVTNECRACFSKRQLGYRADNIEDYRAYARARQRAHRQKHWLTYRIYNQLYRLANPDYRAHRDRSAEKRRWRERDPELAAKKDRESAARVRERLSDAYVRRCIDYGLPSLRRDEIPQSLIAAKRLQIQINRHIKEASK